MKNKLKIPSVAERNAEIVRRENNSLKVMKEYPAEFIEELKTLKDIEGKIIVKATGKIGPNSGKPLADFNGEIQNILITNEWVKREKLKVEVVKWRKNIYKLWREWFSECYVEKITKKLFGEWLLDRIFNITEEDLKEKNGK